MSVQCDKHIFIITNTMQTIGVDKITLFDESILEGDEYTDDA